MGEAEEHQERLALKILVGDRLALVIDELERPADRRRRHDRGYRIAAGHDEEQCGNEDQSGQKRAEDQQQPGGARIHHAYPKQAAIPARIISRNTTVP